MSLEELSPERIPTFEELARLPDDRLDFALGAALVARDVIESLDVREVLGRLHALGEPLAGQGIEGRSATDQADAVIARFRELGFLGNASDYYDPKNSLLPDVLERRLGIPITLALVFCALAERAGVVARPIAFPGHVLVRVDKNDDTIIVDPFAGARIIDDEAAGQLLRRAVGRGAELDRSLFEPAPARGMLVRLLTNLKSIWATRGEHARAFLAIDRILTLTPNSARVLRERAAAAQKLGADAVTRADLARVLELEPEAPDAKQIKARLEKMSEAPMRPLN